MSKNTKRGLLALSLLLVLFPLTVQKPGMPVTLKADEPAYYMMALSLGHDFDLRCEQKDIRRGFDEYPFLPKKNFILMTDDAWQNTYFGKPFTYSLVAAPLARFFGANGLVSLNMLFLVAMIWMAIDYLRRYNSEGLSTIFAVGFFLVSHTFSYTFWLQPELFNMAAVTLSLYLVFCPRDPDKPRAGPLAGLRDRLFRPALMPIWSGGALALAVYNKPMLVVLALPVLGMGSMKDIARRVAAFAAGGAIVTGLLAGFSIAMTGHPSAYLGVMRAGVAAEHPDVFPIERGNTAVVRDDPTGNSWGWIYENLPQGIAREQGNNLKVLWEDMGYFLWGRHTGMFPYEVFGWLCLLFFLWHGRRSRQRWLLLLSLVGVAGIFLLWIPFNWHGGGGFVGNRYFVNAYPGFLFLVTRIRPVWGVYLAYALGSLYLGPMLLTPFGAPVHEPTLQAHTRGAPYRLLPLEFSIRRKIPGYRSTGHSDLGFMARKDNSRFDTESLWLQGASSVELWGTSEEPLGEVIFEIVNRAPGNVVEIAFGGDRKRLAFDSSPPHTEKITLRPRKYKVLHDWGGYSLHVYKMSVDSSTGQPTRISRQSAEEFYVGAQVTYLGNPEVYAQDLFGLRWIECELPQEVEAGSDFGVRVVYRNMSEFDWPHQGPLRIALSYHWNDEDGNVVVRDGRRTRLRKILSPRQRMKDVVQVTAPKRPGSYELELDPLRERVNWFSERDAGDECRGMVDVVPSTEKPRTETSDTPPAKKPGGPPAKKTAQG